MNKKQKVLTEIFRICQKQNNFVFDNDLVKKISKKHKFGNPFDATKIDSSEKLAKIMLKNDVFVSHIGSGKHKFIKGINKAYHNFEKIDKKNIIQWKYKKSILNEYDTSESNILSVASNQKIIHNFLYQNIVVPIKVYNARRTKTSFEYQIDKEKVEMDNIQIEIDLTMELDGLVTVFEGKNNFSKDFAVYQIYHPFLYFTKIKKENRLPIKKISACYILRKKIDNISILRLYNYTFDDENDITSIKLLKSAEYHLIKK